MALKIRRLSHALGAEVMGVDIAVIDYSTPERAAESRRCYPAAAHPVVRVHSETGQPR